MLLYNKKKVNIKSLGRICYIKNQISQTVGSFISLQIGEPVFTHEKKKGLTKYHNVTTSFFGGVSRVILRVDWHHKLKNDWKKTKLLGIYEMWQRAGGKKRRDSWHMSGRRRSRIQWLQPGNQCRPDVLVGGGYFLCPRGPGNLCREIRLLQTM